jgi:hypothetical protein
MSVWNIYFQHMKFKWIFLSLLVGLPLLSIIMSFYWVEWIISIIFVVAAVLCGLYVYRETTRINQEKYRLNTIEEVYNLRKKEFQDYIKDKKLLEPDKLDDLIQLVELNAEQLRTSFFIKGGVLVAVILPIWVQFITYTFSIINGIEEAFYLFIYLLYAAVLLGWVLYICKAVFIDKILFGKYYKMKNMSLLLKEIRLIPFQ